MFNKKIIEEYKKIIPSDELGKRIAALDRQDAAYKKSHEAGHIQPYAGLGKKAPVFNIRQLTTAVACIAVILIASVIALNGNFNAGPTVLCGGSRLGAHMLEISPEYAEYVGEPSAFSLENDPRAREIFSTGTDENRFLFSVSSSSKSSQTLSVDSGRILIFDTELNEFVDNGMFTVVDRQCEFYWCLPLSDADEVYIMDIIDSKKSQKIEMRYEKQTDKYTVGYQKK